MDANVIHPPHFGRGGRLRVDTVGVRYVNDQCYISAALSRRSLPSPSNSPTCCPIRLIQSFSEKCCVSTSRQSVKTKEHDQEACPKTWLCLTNMLVSWRRPRQGVATQVRGADLATHAGRHRHTVQFQEFLPGL